MSSLGVLRDLAEFFLPVGYVGAAIAVLCALVVLIAFAWGAAGAVGGAVGVWIGGAMLSLASGFSGEWMPALASIVALAVALVVGGVVRAVVVALTRRPKSVRLVPDETAPVAVARPSAVG